MTIRQPLVLGSDGLPQQLQAGDSLNAPTNTPSIRPCINGEASTSLVLGMPVYASATGTVKRARANAKTTSKLVGLCYDSSIAFGAIGNIAQDGVLIGSTAQWDAVAGTTGGLVFGTAYFLDAATPGKLTSTAPTIVGQCNTFIGMALSTTELVIELELPILL